MATRAVDNDLEKLLQLIGPLKTPVQVRKIEIAKVNSDGTVSPQCPDFISKEQAYEDIVMLGYLLKKPAMPASTTWRPAASLSRAFWTLCGRLLVNPKGRSLSESWRVSWRGLSRESRTTTSYSWGTSSTTARPGTWMPMCQTF